MNLIAQVFCTVTGYLTMTARAVLLIALVPSWIDGVIADERLQLIGVALSFVVLLYSNSLVQSAELKFMNGADWSDVLQELRHRFSFSSKRWHRDLLILNGLSGFFGAGLAINLQISQNLSDREARLAAIIATLIAWAGIVLLHRGSERFQLRPPTADK
ncbi:MAG: hypothetical protein ACYTGL_26930 [Planctomycetota bacterium]